MPCRPGGKDFSQGWRRSHLDFDPERVTLCFEESSALAFTQKLAIAKIDLKSCDDLTDNAHYAVGISR